MNKTKIEWADYTINPIKGLCKNTCPYCYAKKMYKRFKWDPRITCDFSVFDDVAKLKNPSRIFVGSTHDIFGDWILNRWIRGIFNYCENFPQHIFIFLTKYPQRLLQFGGLIPCNVYLGYSYIYDDKESAAGKNLLTRSFALKHFISFEPLLNDFNVLNLKGIEWVIIGGLTPRPVHKNEWVEKIINNARELNMPVFLKDNLKYPEEIKEFPEWNN